MLSVPIECVAANGTNNFKKDIYDYYAYPFIV